VAWIIVNLWRVRKIVRREEEKKEEERKQEASLSPFLRGHYEERGD